MSFVTRFYNFITNTDYDAYNLYCHYYDTQKKFIVYKVDSKFNEEKS
jgi:hypothetical protein